MLRRNVIGQSNLDLWFAPFAQVLVPSVIGKSGVVINKIDALDFAGDKVDVSVKGAAAASISGNDFQQALLSIWLGKKPPNPELKEGLLGG